MVNEMLWASGMTVIVQCYAVRGLEVVAAQNISSTITNLFNIVYIQLGGSISIIVGQLLGAGKIKEAKEADNKMIFFCVFCCCCIAAVMAVVGRFFLPSTIRKKALKTLLKLSLQSPPWQCPYAPSHTAPTLLCVPAEKLLSLSCSTAYTPGCLSSLWPIFWQGIPRWQ